MGMSSGGGHRAVPYINVTPLIDVLLVLLIIFMMIQPQVPVGLKSQIPQPSKESTSPPPSTVVVEVLPGEGNQPIYKINQKAVPRSEMLGELRGIFVARRDRTMRNRAGSGSRRPADPARA